MSHIYEIDLNKKTWCTHYNRYGWC